MALNNDGTILADPEHADYETPEPIDFYPPRNNPERAEWFRYTRPKIDFPKLHQFWRGIRATRYEAELLTVGVSQLVGQLNLKDITCKDDLKEVVPYVLLIGENIMTNIHAWIVGYDQGNPVPDDWLQLWVMTFLFEVWVSDYHGQDEDLLPEGQVHEFEGFGVFGYDSKKPEEGERLKVASQAGARIVGPIVPPKTSSTAGGISSMQTQGQQTTQSQPRTQPAPEGIPGEGYPKPERFNLIVTSVDRSRELCSVRINAGSCLAKDGSTYVLRLLRLEFERALGEIRYPFNLKHGAFGYEGHGALVTFKPLEKQEQLLPAITHLSKVAWETHAGDRKNVLDFHFYPEDALRKANRESRERAKTRADGLKAKNTPAEKPAPKNDNRNVTGSAKPTPPASFQQPAPTSKSKPRFLSKVGDVARKIGSRVPKPQEPSSNTLPNTRKAAGVQGTTSGRTAGPKTNRLSMFGSGNKPQKPDDTTSGKGKGKELQACSFEELSHETFLKGSNDKDKIPSLADEGVGFAEELAFTQGSEDSDNEEDGKGDNITGTEFLAHELQKLVDSPELTQVPDIKDVNADLSEWVECCELFKIDSNNQSNLELIKVAGLKSRLYPFQVFGTFWQMKNSRANGGGFVGDEMGLGKTLSFLAYIVVERQLSMLYGLVEKCQKSGSGKHHQVGSADAHLPCPSEKERPFWIACPCSTSSPSYRMKPKPGLRLAVVPPQLVKQWMGEWDKHIDNETSSLGMRLAVVHPPAFPEQGTPDTRDANKNGATRKYLASKKSKLTGANATEEDLPTDDQEKWLVLTSKQYYYPWAKLFPYLPKTNNSDKKAPKPSKNAGLVFGIAMVDECHETHFRELKPRDPKKFYNRGGVLYDLPLTNSPFIWGYSGTPLVSSPRGLEPILWSIEQRTHQYRITDSETKSEWQTKKSLGLEQFTWANLDALCTTFDNWVKGELGFDVMPDLRPGVFPFLKKFLIRRTAESRWFGHPLMRLKPHYHQDITLKTNPKHDADLNIFHARYFVPEKEATIKETQKRFMEVPHDGRIGMYRVTALNFPQEWHVARVERIFATFPYLVTIALTGVVPRRLTFEKAETKRWSGKTQYKQSLYYEYLDKIVGSSPKTAWLTKFLCEWTTVKEEDCGEDDKISKRPKKLVIATQFDVVALVLQLYFEKYHPTLYPTTKLILSTTPPRERSAILASFSTDPKVPATARERAAAANQRETPKVEIIIGNTHIIGKGLNLTRASTLILMEPDISFSKEAQIYSRVHRIGQKATVTQSYRLWCENPDARVGPQKTGPYYDKWEWEGKAVDRVRERQLTFGRKQKRREKKEEGEPGTDTEGEMTEAEGAGYETDISLNVTQDSSESPLSSPKNVRGSFDNPPQTTVEADEARRGLITAERAAEMASNQEEDVYGASSDEEDKKRYPESKDRSSNMVAAQKAKLERDERIKALGSTTSFEGYSSASASKKPKPKSPPRSSHDNDRGERIIPNPLKPGEQNSFLASTSPITPYSPTFAFGEAREVGIQRVTASSPIDSRTGSEYGESSADDYKDKGKRNAKIPSVGRLKDVRVSGKRFEAVESDCSSIGAGA